jgi:hypothetical protein
MCYGAAPEYAPLKECLMGQRIIQDKIVDRPHYALRRSHLPHRPSSGTGQSHRRPRPGGAGIAQRLPWSDRTARQRPGCSQDSRITACRSGVDLPTRRSSRSQKLGPQGIVDLTVQQQTWLHRIRMIAPDITQLLLIEASPTSQISFLLFPPNRMCRATCCVRCLTAVARAPLRGTCIHRA